MKSKAITVVSITVAVAISGAVLLRGNDKSILHAQSATLSATQQATANLSATQCSLIDALVASKLATPAATQSTATRIATSSATAPAMSATAKPATSAPTVVLPTATPAEVAAGESGGDESLTTYRDAKQKFSIGYPHSWSQETTFKSGSCFTGRDASIAVQFVPGPVPADLLAYVKADEANVQAGAASYKQIYLKASDTIPGAVVLGYEWNAAKSTVTEKPVRARTDRYYLIDKLGRFVIISETDPINQFDPAGVSDTVLTYQTTN